METKEFLTNEEEQYILAVLKPMDLEIIFITKAVNTIVISDSAFNLITIDLEYCKLDFSYIEEGKEYEFKIK